MGDSNMRNLSIEFDRKNGIYKPGEMITGRILVRFTQSKQIRGLAISIIGESVVGWSSGRNNSVDVYDLFEEQIEPAPTLAGITDREEYFSTKLFLLGNESGPSFVLPAGEFTYPFKYLLPLNIPYSFKHKHGFVGYSIKANICKSWAINDQATSAFYITSTYDLNRNPGAFFSIREDMIKDFFCSCMCPTGKIYARLSVPWIGFVPGQVIPITFHCENESTVDVKKIKISLRKRLRFHAKTQRRYTKVIESIVAENNRLRPFTNNFEEKITMQLTVPPLPPSGLEHCGLIDVDYVLRIVICFSGMHFSVKRRFPILIGTVPLSESVDTYRSDAGTVSSAASIPSHCSDPQNLPPLSYYTSMPGFRIIRDEDGPVDVHNYAGNSFALPYPVHGYSPASI